MKCPRCSATTYGTQTAGGLTIAVCGDCLAKERRELEDEYYADDGNNAILGVFPASPH